jgi:hypothetical protein
VILLTAIDRSDIAIAVSFEIPPFLSTGSESDYQESMQMPFRVAYNTPLVSPLVPFANCAEALGMHPATASILDEMRFMISTVLALPAEPTEKQLKKVQTTSAWIYQRMAKLPHNSPDEAQASQESQEPLSRKEEKAPEIPVDPRLATPETDSARPHYSPPGSVDDSLGAGPGSTSTASRRPSSHSLRSTHSDSSQPRARSGSPSSPAALPPGAAMPAPDALYQAVRLTALVYARAISERRPFSEVVEPADFIKLWTTAWRVSLTAWKGLAGVFTWLTLSIVASARDTPHDRFVKSMLAICTVQTSLECWEIASAALRAALRLNAWLMAGKREREEKGVAKAGGESSGEAEGASSSGGPAEPTAGTHQMDVEDEDQDDPATVDFDEDAEPTKFSGGGKAIREQGSAIPSWYVPPQTKD